MRRRTRRKWSHNQHNVRITTWNYRSMTKERFECCQDSGNCGDDLPRVVVLKPHGAVVRFLLLWCDPSSPVPQLRATASAHIRDYFRDTLVILRILQRPVTNTQHLKDFLGSCNPEFENTQQQHELFDKEPHLFANLRSDSPQ